MASADQLKALLLSHLNGDEDRFFAVAMQVAAQEARSGHGKLAQELRALIDKAKGARGTTGAVPIRRPRGELANLLTVSYPKARLADMVLGESLSSQIQRIVREQRFAGRILQHGLSPRRKMLLVGPPGTGKTLTASVLAGELALPLLQVRLDGLITRFLGETAAKLRQIFEATSETRGVYFFDEFDAIGSHRGSANDVGEIRRVLNSFLQMIEQDESNSLIVAATNHPDLLDAALFRRFDDVLHYELPDESQVAALMKRRLSASMRPRTAWRALAKQALGLSYAEITRAADEVLKDTLMRDAAQASESDVVAALDERRRMAGRRIPARE